MSGVDRLEARQVGKHYAKLGEKVGGFTSFSQFVRFLRSIEMPTGEELTPEQVTIAWIWVKKQSKKMASKQMNLGV